MTNTEFVEETNNLEKFFDKELKDYERAIWFKELKGLDVSRYRQIIREAYKRCRILPKLSEIIKINNELPKTKTQKEDKSEMQCDFCKNNRIHYLSKDYQKRR